MKNQWVDVETQLALYRMVQSCKSCKQNSLDVCVSVEDVLWIDDAVLAAFQK